MKTTIENISGCARKINIEVPAEELNQKLEEVFADIRKVARVPGFRTGRAPRDLLETHYGKKAEEELIKRAIPEYYLKAIKQEQLMPVAAPEIENVQLKNHTLCFNARVDIQPQVRLKAYKGLRITRKKIKIDQNQIEKTLERLRQVKVKQQQDAKKEKMRLPELNDVFAKSLGCQTLPELKEAIAKNLAAEAKLQIKADTEAQIIEQLLKRAALDVPQSLVNSQMPELLNRLKLNRLLQGEKKEDVQSKTKELEVQARLEAMRRVKLSFILNEIAQLENIQIKEEELNERITEISQQSGKTKDEVRRYLDRENLIPSLKEELRHKKTMQFLLNEAKIEEK